MAKNLKDIQEQAIEEASSILEENNNELDVQVASTSEVTQLNQALIGKLYSSDEIAKEQEQAVEEKIEEEKKKHSFFGKIKYVFSEIFTSLKSPTLESPENEKEYKDNVRVQAQIRGAKLRSVRIVWIVFFGLCTLLIWAYFAQIDSIVRGSGQVVPSQRIQQIQNLEGGIIQEILVQEGELVQVGTVLARIENTTAISQYREAAERSLNYQASIARLQALIDNAVPVYPEEVRANKSLVDRHNNIFKATKDQSDAEANILQLQLESLRNELQDETIQLKQLKDRLVLASKQRDLAKEAFAAEAYSEIDLINQEQNVQKIQSDILALEFQLPRLELEIQEQQEKLTQFRADLILEYSTELGEIEAQLVSVNELLKAGIDKVRRTELISPVNGTVRRIYQTTLGGVVQPGATIMDVVPLDDSLIIEAKFSPADIGFLSVGLPATVRLTAYDFATYGSVEATVEHISADTLEDNQGQIYYIVNVSTKNNYLEYQGRQLPIIAGMQAEIDIVTGKKSILDYLLKPFIRVSNRAFTEQ